MTARTCFSGRGRPIAFVLGVLTLLTAEASAAADYDVRVVGAQFAESPPQNDKALAAFNLQHGGGELVVLVSGSGPHKIIDLDDDASEKKLSATLLQGGNEVGKTAIDVWPFVKTTKDGKHLLAQLKIDGALPADAESLRLGGALVIVTAVSQEVATVKDISVEPGTQFALGPAQIEIAEVGKPQWGGDQYAAEVTLKSDQMIERIAKLEFFDAQGAPLEAAEGSTMSMGFGGTRTVKIAYRLKSRPDQVSLKATYWKGLKHVEVPVDLKVLKPY